MLAEADDEMIQKRLAHLCKRGVVGFGQIQP